MKTPPSSAHGSAQTHAANQVIGDETRKELDARLAAAVSFARAAGDITLGYFQSDRFKVETKLDGTAVTTADREAEQHLRKQIAAAFPDDGVLGEEFGEQPGSSGFRWILDPIDGTASFVCGVPLYGTLIGVELGTEVVAGVIHLPAMNEMVYAAAGSGAWHVVGGKEPARARVSKIATLEKSVVCSTGYEYFVREGRPELFAALAAGVGKYRGWSDCYSHVLAATGRVEGVVEPTIRSWDVAPAMIVMREAGGRFTDFSGNESIHTGTSVLSNGLVHEALIEIVRPR